MNEKKNAAVYPMGEETPAGRRLKTGLTPCIMFVLTGTLGYGLTNVLPEVVQQANAAAYYGILTILIQIISAVASPLAGSLGDLWGRKKLLAGCLLLFTLSGALIGFSPNAVMLFGTVLLMMLVFTICQTSTSAMIFDAVKEPMMSTLMGIRHSCGQLAFLTGPIVMGALAAAFGIKSACLVAVPFGAVSLLLVMLYTPNICYERRSKKIDWAGAVLLFLAMGGISVYFAFGQTAFAWASVTGFVLILISAVSTWLLYRTEKKADNPLIDLHIFGYTQIRPLLVYKVLMQTSNGAFGAWLILYCQEVMGWDSVKTGWFGMARIAAIIGSACAGRWVIKMGKVRWMSDLATLLSLIAGMILVLIHPGMPFGLLMLAQVFLALNTSFGTLPLTLMLPQILPKELVGNGYGVLYFCENLGSVIGTAAAALIVNLAGGGQIRGSMSLVALSFVLFTAVRFLITAKGFPKEQKG